MEVARSHGGKLRASMRPDVRHQPPSLLSCQAAATITDNAVDLEGSLMARALYITW